MNRKRKLGLDMLFVSIMDTKKGIFKKRHNYQEKKKREGVSINGGRNKVFSSIIAGNQQVIPEVEKPRSHIIFSRFKVQSEEL